MEYNDEYAGGLFSETQDENYQKAEKDKYSIEVDEGFALPPLMLCFRFTGHPSNPRLQEEVAKACIAGRKVTIKKNGQAVGAFCCNGLSDSLDAFPPLRENPLAFTQLMNSAHAFVLRKFQPSTKNTQTVESAANEIMK